MKALSKKAQKAVEIHHSTEMLNLYTSWEDGKRALIYGQVAHRSASGLTRSVRLFVVYAGELLELTGYTSAVLGGPIDRYGGIPVSGCGFDAIGHVLERLAFKLGLPHGGLEYFRL